MFWFIAPGRSSGQVCGAAAGFAVVVQVNRCRCLGSVHPEKINKEEAEVNMEMLMAWHTDSLNNIT